VNRTFSNGLTIVQQSFNIIQHSFNNRYQTFNNHFNNRLTIVQHIV